MIQIQSVKLVNGKSYNSWQEVFESQEARNLRANAGINVLAYGWNDDKERVFTVVEINDPQTVQKFMLSPEAASILKKSGTDTSTLEMIPLPNGKPGI